MKIIVFGDIHGTWGPVERIAKHELPERGVILSVGDLCNYRFEVVGDRTFVFVWGNHESEGYLQQKTANQKSTDAVYALTPGAISTLVDGTRVAGLSGVYSEHLFEATNRPLKYYGKEDVEKMKALTGIDVLLTHEAPLGVGMAKEGKDLGRPEVREIIERVQPRLAVFGHHHVYHEGQIGATRVIGLQQPKHSYVILDTDMFSTEQVSAGLSTEKIPQWMYAWER